jgi:hypothetical protein
MYCRLVVIKLCVLLVFLMDLTHLQVDRVLILKPLHIVYEMFFQI